MEVGLGFWASKTLLAAVKLWTGPRSTDHASRLGSAAVA